MQPLINLKQFLAVLALLIIPAALLTAYFRNYDPEAGGHEHGAQAGRQSAPMADHHGGDAQKPPASGLMDHSKMPGTTAGQPAPAELTEVQVEASRKQLDASRAQLEASRKLLEATPGVPQPQAHAPGQPPDAAEPPAKPAATGATPPPKATDGHDHKH